jgi:signal transduction histidine kinase
VRVSAYRIVQEALTNVLKHSPGSRTRVAIDYGRTDLTISVVDDGDGPKDVGTGLPSAGYGLAGMRERVRLFGGTLSAGSQSIGGWAITATMPIPSPS